MRYYLLISRYLLGLAWLLLLICMFLPQGGFVYRGNTYSFKGWEIAWLAAYFGPLILPSPFFGDTTGSQLVTMGITIFLSELLFVASPLVLLGLKPGRLTSRSIYAILCLICAILLARLAPTIVSHLDPTNEHNIQLLPGMFVWLAAQVTLTLAAGIQLAHAYLLNRPQFD